MMSAVLSNPGHPEYGVATIPFPIPRDQYTYCMDLLEALEIGDAVKADCKVEKIDSFYTVLKRTEMLTVNLAYSQADRRERYVREEQFSGKILSLEQMAEDDLLPDYVGAEAAPSAEEEALEREQAQSLAERKEMLLLAMLSLNDADRELINALFFDGASTRDYAARIGITQRAVIKRRDRILRDLKKYFENFSN